MRAIRWRPTAALDLVSGEPGPAVRCPPRELAIVALLGGLALGLLYVVVTRRAGLFLDDARHYGLLAQDPAAPVRLPYTFRVLTPTLAWLLPLDTESAFALVTLAALWGAAVLLYVLVRGLGLGRFPAGFACAAFLGSGATTRALTTPMYVDPLSYVAELAAFGALLWRREALFAAALLLGVLNRETALLLAPVYPLWCRALGRSWGATLVRTGLAVGPASLALGLVVAWKVGLLLTAGQPIDELLWHPKAFREQLPSLTDLADVYSTFGACWLLALANLRAAPQPLRSGLVYGLALLIQLWVARGDEGRVLAHLLPLALPLAAVELGRHRPGGRIALLVACLLSTLDARWVVLPSTALRYAAVAFGSGLAACLLLAARLGRVRIGTREGEPGPVDRSQPDTGVTAR